MNILVVGGAGYIGSHICKALKALHWNPITYDNLSTGHSWAVQFGPFIEGDLEDEWTLMEAFESYQPKAVIHLASKINVREASINPGLYYEKNLFGTVTLLKTMVKMKVPHLVFSSTAAIYGSPQYVPIDETHPKMPLNAYGKTKWAIEGMLQDFFQAHDLRYCALRYFNACGADAEGLIGEAHEPETHLIPRVIQSLWDEAPFQIYGNDFPTPDGTAIRDYIHVNDLAQAHIRALQYLMRGDEPVELNLGTGMGYSVQQIVNAVEQFAKQKVLVQMCDRLPHDAPILVADPALAKKTLHWEPVYSDLHTIIKTAWHWHLKVRNRLDINILV